jgi:hypothetical protein
MQVREEMRWRRHQPVREQGKWLDQVVRGFFAYHAVPTNTRALNAFRHRVMDLWRRSLKRRSQRDRTTWERIAKLADDFLPKPGILHPGLTCGSPSITEVGAECLNGARSDLCGGALSNKCPCRDHSIWAGRCSVIGSMLPCTALPRVGGSQVGPVFNVNFALQEAEGKSLQNCLGPRRGFKFVNRDKGGRRGKAEK